MSGAIVAALFLGRYVFSHGGALAVTGISAGDALAGLSVKVLFSRKKPQPY